MAFQYRDSGIVTTKLAESRDFYTGYLGFTVVVELDWYVHLKKEEVEIGFLTPGHPSQPADLAAPFSGAGVWLSLQVDDVDAEYERLKAAGAPVGDPPKDEPWGERHFILRDPNGVVLNLAKSIPPSQN